MIEARKTAITLDPEELLRMVRIISVHDRDGAIAFLEEIIFGKIAQSQRREAKLSPRGRRGESRKEKMTVVAVISAVWAQAFLLPHRI